MKRSYCHKCNTIKSLSIVKTYGQLQIIEIVYTAQRLFIFYFTGIINMKSLTAGRFDNLQFPVSQ